MDGSLAFLGMKQNLIKFGSFVRQFRCGPPNVSFSACWLQVRGQTHLSRTPPSNLSRVHMHARVQIQRGRAHCLARYGPDGYGMHPGRESTVPHSHATSTSAHGCRCLAPRPSLAGARNTQYRGKGHGQTRANGRVPRGGGRASMGRRTSLSPRHRGAIPGRATGGRAARRARWRPSPPACSSSPTPSCSRIS